MGPVACETDALFTDSCITSLYNFSLSPGPYLGDSRFLYNALREISQSLCVYYILLCLVHPPNMVNLSGME